MQLTARYFAAFREAAGLEEESLQSDAATPAELFSQCQEKHPGLQTFEASMVAINDEMAGWNDALCDGDVVLFFPPVAGG